MPIIDGLAGFQNPAPTGLAAIGSKFHSLFPGESVNATLVLKMHYRNVIAVLVCSAGLIHQHSLNYSLLNREIRKHSKHKFKLNLIVTKVNVVRYQNYMSVESDFAECRRVARGFTQADTLYFSLTDRTNRRIAAPVGQEFHLLPLVAVSRCTTGFSANR